MLELYQFEPSSYCEKIRLILDYKGLEYRKVSVSPGLGQLELFQKSGQRQVPVLQDNSRIIPDSTAIAQYLEQQYPDRPLIPTDPRTRGLCWQMEQWADEVIGPTARKGMIQAIGQSPTFRAAILPETTPDVLKTLVGAIPGDFFSLLGTGVGMGPETAKQTEDSLKLSLSALTDMVSEQPYLVGDQPTIADFAVAGATMYIKFPAGAYLNIPESLKGQGIPGIADRPDFAPFFTWRDRLYVDFRKATPSPASSAPTAINID